MNTMTGDPNQEHRQSVFSFEPYPSLNVQPIDWSRIPSNSIIPSNQFSSTLTYQHPKVGLGHFSFCSTQTPHPAQFPFPHTSSVGDGNVHSSSPTIATRCKRKTETLSFQPCKQLITEEKMAEHMSKLRINSETASSSNESSKERTRRLYMCEEMRKLQTDTILPQSLLSRIQRPCTALVLWTPPRRLVPPESLEAGNNNEEAIPDKMTNEEVMESEMNNMDLDSI